MAGENEVNSVMPDYQKAVQRIAEDAYYAMLKDMTAPNKGLKMHPEAEKLLRNILTQQISDAVLQSGYIEKCNNTVYKEDLMDDMDRFVTGSGANLPLNFDKTVISGAIQNFYQNAGSYLSQLDHLRETDSRYQSWIEDHEVDVNFRIIATLQESGAIAETALWNYNKTPREAVSRDNTTFIDAQKADDPHQIILGDENKMASEDLDYGNIMFSSSRSAAKFDEIFEGKLPQTDCMKNPVIQSEYKHPINLFTINGERVNYRETGNPEEDKKNLDHVKAQILGNIAMGQDVEFTKFTMDNTGKCSVENIPIAHANDVKNGGFKDRVYNAQGLKTLKLAQKVTDKMRKETERKHKRYLAQTKKAEKEWRKQVVRDYERRIKSEVAYDKKDKLKEELAALKDGFKKVDIAQKAREKQTKAENKARIKAEKQEQKYLINEFKYLQGQQKWKETKTARENEMRMEMYRQREQNFQRRYMQHMTNLQQSAPTAQQQAPVAANTAESASRHRASFTSEVNGERSANKTPDPKNNTQTKTVEKDGKNL